jgi:hypothetical protein
VLGVMLSVQASMLNRSNTGTSADVLEGGNMPKSRLWASGIPEQSDQ